MLCYILHFFKHNYYNESLHKSMTIDLKGCSYLDGLDRIAKSIPDFIHFRLHLSPPHQYLMPMHLNFFFLLIGSTTEPLRQITTLGVISYRAFFDGHNRTASSFLRC